MEQKIISKVIGGREWGVEGRRSWERGTKRGRQTDGRENEKDKGMKRDREGEGGGARGRERREEWGGESGRGEGERGE